MDEKSILQMNIERFRRMLEAESDEAKRSVISRLLTEEEEKMERFRSVLRRAE